MPSKGMMMLTRREIYLLQMSTIANPVPASSAAQRATRLGVVRGAATAPAVQACNRETGGALTSFYRAPPCAVPHDTVILQDRFAYRGIGNIEDLASGGIAVWLSFRLRLCKP
jgi:hypothetical protein